LQIGCNLERYFSNERTQIECCMWSLSELYKPFHTCNRCNNFDGVQQFRGCSNYVGNGTHDIIEIDSRHLILEF
jgi:hypothetical protein